ncbi:chromosome segregation protein SMC [Bacillus cereus]|uniref:Chromosome partition protein Smc n=1 Tax=Bacillus cereus TaxID=1396 RepID=A0AA44TG10_BACCE|nr:MULTISPECIES: chromosome segregation protein SMC [Bacillus cereus group]PFA23952.1 chromosome segregation protein SMC [Bacillus cereus]PFN08092.1 chromosome segregation protein SMC [Bacillus cereus]PFO85238.1 chromosome segregation protein SMC [Bacillus cereus]PFR29240.1 chromosome segregation protein SMC [Bacillus cereus]PFS05915.1 chromosome segregation protein SMC [Bacillus cereus]
MFLKRLEIAGFKSFAERVSVDFVPGVTSVVGPNGSGKSNITDAIRWVLGEQSAKSLRGAKMEDIIFAGSDTRKAVNVAEVTLTLNNEDQRLPIEYNEVCVTRRVSRSGDSDFFINKQSCRLKDIVDLFMDSGMGREAFSIISQGKVEEILSSKSEERRGVFEEAAGVLKYKLRKKKAEGKLAETQENLNRVQDIIHELSSQVEPLERQASIAKDYLEKKEELEKVEAALIVYEIEELHEKWEELRKQFANNKDEEVKMSTHLHQSEADLEELRGQLQAIDESVDSLQEVLLLSSKELEKLEGQRELLKERKQNATTHCAQLEQLIIELTEKAKVYDGEIETGTEELMKFADQVKELEQKLYANEKLLSTYAENLEEQIEHLKGDYIELLNQQASHRNELSMLEEQFKQQNSKNQRLDEENEKYVQMRMQITSKKGKLVEGYEQVKENVTSLITNIQKTEAALGKCKVQYSENETKLYQAYQFVQQARSRKEMLEEMQEDYSGFYQGVREVLKARESKLHGIEGAVAELLTVPKEYEVAMEIALGAAMQHVVVQTEEHARAAIAFLKQNRHGRATFLPQAVIKGRSLSFDQLRMVKQHPSFVGVATELVHYNNKYENIVSNLLGTVVVAKDLRGANELAKQLQYRYRIVTIEGDVVNPGGSMTGGAVKQAKSSLLGRQRELEEWSKKLVEMEEKTSKLENFVKALKQEIQEKEVKIKELRYNAEQERVDEQKLKEEINQLALEEHRINDRLSIYDLEIEGFLQDQVKMQERKEELARVLANLQTDIIKMDEKIVALTKQKSEQHSSKEKVQTEITELKVQAAEKQQRLSNQKEKVDRLTKEQEETQRNLVKTTEDLAFLKQEMTSNSSGEEQITSMIEKKAHDRNQTSKLISSRREQRLTLQERVEHIEREVKDTKGRHKYVLEVLKDQEVKINRLDVELENRLKHLRETYTISFEAAKLKYTMTMPAEDARKKVKLIKLSIEELGTVNLGAIEEYERVAERHTFLLEQRDDLEEAKATLHQVITEMDEEMKKRFSTTFEAIREEFRFVFCELFGGGRADLVMTNPQDLLNTGIDIVAQPPGKKLQNLGLLSGGERALTAIALLFGILKVRPVPFCVLDEVEAALDEANVARFAQYLKKFSDETQFIVITHRKGTMEESDVLYGVTMQESGVSRLVSVRLGDVEEELVTSE